MVLVLLDGDESDPVSDLVLLQVSLSQVLQVLTGELGVGDNNNLVTFGGDRDVVTQVTNDAVDLDVFNQVLDVSFLVKDTVFNWGRSVNDKLLGGTGFLGGLPMLAYCTSITKYTLNGVVDIDSIAQGRVRFYGYIKCWRKSAHCLNSSNPYKGTASISID